jgi:hypothetical protein
MLPTALPGYIILIRPTFDLFPGMSDPEIKSELIAALNDFNVMDASTRNKSFFIQNLAHLVLLDIDNVKKWKNDYENELQSLKSDTKFIEKTTRVEILIDDYIKYYLPVEHQRKR